MNTLKKEIHEQHNFKELISAVEAQLKSDESQSIGKSKKITRELTNIPAPSDVFIGRDEKLEEIHKKLFGENRIVVVNGVGGIGKTTLAHHYINNYKNNYDNIAFITFQFDLEKSFATNTLLIKNLGVDVTNMKAEEIFISIIQKLKNIQEGSSNLLVIDNAEYQKELEDLPHSGSWHLLITSRERLLPKFSRIELDTLNKEDSKKMFRKFCPDKLTDVEIEDLNESVGYHTLAIEVLSKTANEISGVKFEKLKSAIPVNMKTSIMTEGGGVVENITEFFRSTFSIAKLNDEEKNILIQFTAIPPLSIEYSDLEIFLDGITDELNIILKKLSDKGWIQREGDTYSMHRLIHQILRKEFSYSEEKLGNLIANITVLLTDQSKDNPIDKFKYGFIFGDVILEIFPNSKSSEISSLKNNLALVYKRWGNYEKARDLLEKALESDSINFGDKHPNVAVRQSNLALVYTDLKEYVKARDLLEKALESDLINFGDKHPNVADSQSNLALVYKNLGEYEKARDLLEKALESDLINFGDKDPNVVFSQSNLALVYNALGEYEKARDLLEKAIESLFNFGDKYPKVAVRRSNVAVRLSDMGLLIDPRFAQAVLATVYFKLGKFNEALTLFNSFYESTQGENPFEKSTKEWIELCKAKGGN